MVFEAGTLLKSWSKKNVMALEVDDNSPKNIDLVFIDEKAQNNP